MASAQQMIRETFQKEFKGVKDENYDYRSLYRQRLIEFRKTPASITRLSKPTNIARARSLGYKAKKGFIVARVKIRKGSGAHKRPATARRPKRMGVNKLTRNLSIRLMAEKRVARKYPKYEVLNSYWIGKDGKQEYFEVILVDTNHPEIIKDKKYANIAGKNKNKVFKGKTSAGRKSRGLRKKGKGSEKTRPSRNAINRRRYARPRKPLDF